MESSKEGRGDREHTFQDLSLVVLLAGEGGVGGAHDSAVLSSPFVPLGEGIHRKRNRKVTWQSMSCEGG